MNQPTTAATIATAVPARNALTMKWNAKRFAASAISARDTCVSVRVVQARVVARRLRLADHDEPAVGRVQHLDRRLVEARQRLGRDHLVRRARHRAAAPEVHDAIEVA